MNSNDLAELRDRRLRQAEKRGLIRVVRALHVNGINHQRAEWINEKQTIAAEFRASTHGVSVLRVWANLDGVSNGTRVFGGAVFPNGGPDHTPSENIVLEVAFDVDNDDPILESYAPGDWETAFLTWVSTEILEVRLREHREAIAEEGKITAELLREAARWGGEVPGV